MVKLSNVRTKTFVDPTAAGLDAQIEAFVSTLKEEQYLDLKFDSQSVGPGFVLAILIYLR